ncbi:MAG: hypothetical protein AAF517_05775 [Planctomycetota bacterium]
MKQEQGIVADGRQRNINAAVDQIRAEVRAEFEEVLKASSFFERLRIRREMKADLKRRLKELESRIEDIAPKSGLY